MIHIYDNKLTKFSQVLVTFVEISYQTAPDKLNLPFQ